jgi:LuxR family maltose regulon positive regulatory protein
VLSLAGHPAPERFAAEFSGTDRTVAEFLLAEVLDWQSEAVRRLLVRTSLLDRVSGPLADALTGSSGGERVLQDLEQAGAFVVSLDASRTWFRYHQLFADLLQLELRRTEPNERAALHGTAAGWLAEHGHPAEAVRQAQGPRTGGRRPGCCRTTGSTSSSPGREPPCSSCWTRSHAGPSRPARSSPPCRRLVTWSGEPWKTPHGT